MTQDGVDGTAADCRSDDPPRCRAAGLRDIMRDDGRLGPRYIEHAYSHTPAGLTPDHSRRERQTALALSTKAHLPTAISTFSANGPAEPGAIGVYLGQRSR